MPTSAPTLVPTSQPTSTSTPTRVPTNTATQQPTSVPPTATATPSPTATGTARPTLPALAQLSQFESQMYTFGQTHCNTLNGSASQDSKLSGTYYDAAWGYQQIQRYTGDSSWRRCVTAALQVYGTNYTLANNGVIPGFWQFTRGFLNEYLSTGSTSALTNLNLIANNGVFTRDTTPNNQLTDHTMSRENAYALDAKLSQFLAGGAYNARIPTLVNNALGHINQWFVSSSDPYLYVRPFMVGLTARSLIQYWEITRDPRIIPVLQMVADRLWSDLWIQQSLAFKYTNVNTANFPPSAFAYNTGGTEPMPDLNMIVAPLYGFLYHVTGDVKYIERGDLIFKGGVQGAYLTGIKQFNQNFFWSFSYIEWRNEPPLQ